MIQERSRFRRPLEIVLLEGGVSCEREVSFHSGEAVGSALRRRGHQVAEVKVNDRRVSELDSFRGDVAFVALHGRFGEDGGIQQLLERRDIPYTGSGAESSALAMDKLASKEVFRDAGIPTPAWVVVPVDASHDDALRLVDDGPGVPAVIKPLCSGSSIGVEMLWSRDDLVRYLADRPAGPLLVEEMLMGREMTVSILGDRALPVVELRIARDFYDYTAKYGDGGTEYGNAGGVSPTLYREIQAIGLAAHRALGCRAFSRVDLFLADGKEPTVLEVNSIPGLTDHSLLPKAARMEGIDFGDLCEAMIALSVPALAHMDEGRPS